MKQIEARHRADELGGIAIHAYQRFDSGGAPAGWRIGGWPHQKGETWIVVSLDLSEVLDDSRTPDDEITDGRYSPVG